MTQATGPSKHISLHSRGSTFFEEAGPTRTRPHKEPAKTIGDEEGASKGTTLQQQQLTEAGYESQRTRRRTHNMYKGHKNAHSHSHIAL